MQNSLISLLVLFAYSTAAFGNDDGSYSSLNRLHVAMQVRSFPTPVDGKITLWMQETATEGRLRVADIDEWRASHTRTFFNASDSTHDLCNIVIISKNGKHIRFVDPRKEDVSASRGDVVALMLAEKAK